MTLSGSNIDFSDSKSNIQCKTDSGFIDIGMIKISHSSNIIYPQYLENIFNPNAGLHVRRLAHRVRSGWKLK